MNIDIIKKLPEHLINQIKAGEVVERPYNVIKELVENSIDAGARNILLELLDGGKQLIRITDDGKGIAADQIKIALERHATSKISAFKDLETLQSFGFRGEALPSIAAVSHFTIRSKPPTQDSGHELVVNYGEKASEKSLSMPSGTIVQVKEIFKNVPVRLKFLKSTATEFAHIHDFILAMAFCHPTISFKLQHNGRDVLHFSNKKTLLERFNDIIGVDKKDYIALDFQRGSFQIQGFVGLPHIAKTTPNYFITFVNGRYVKDKVIRSGVLQGYQGLLLKGLIAPAIVSITVDPTWIDVNAHPSKTEIRFSDPLTIQEFVSIAIQNQVKAAIQPKQSMNLQSVETNKQTMNFHISETQNSSFQNISPAILEKRELYPNPPTRVNTIQNYEQPKKGMQVAKLTRTESQSMSESPITLMQPQLIPPQQNFFSNAKYLGQYADCYLLLEMQKELWIIDQHAFHERILFEEILVNHQNHKSPKQELLAPIIIPSNAILSDIILENKDKIFKLGFEIEKLKNNHIAIHAFPSFLNTQKIPAIFDEIITRIIAIHGLPQGETHPLIEKVNNVTKGIQEELQLHPTQLRDEDIFHLLFATMACHSAIRAGDPLNTELVQRLLQRANAVDFFSHCPHGRPVIRKFTSKDVSAWFQRI